MNPRKTTQETKVQWFVEPLDDWSNELAARLIGFSAIDAESMGIDIPDRTNKGHNLWQCEWAQVSFLMKSQHRMQIRFRVWKRNGNRGPVERAPDFAQPSPRKHRRK